GPSPFHFVAVPDDECLDIRAIAPDISYGWGVIPATVTIGATTFSTSLFPKNGGYLVPIKDAVRRAEGVDIGDDVAIRLAVPLHR
ncbi:MAG TPA: DUF1905 domain-containing protein, partial [Ilumatobacteraceae bacterium]|nr:DUF1905 domain-containing protein [Ilumatobacteraceae bacterium]